MNIKNYTKIKQTMICLLKNTQGDKMATYECSKCGMSVNATCGKCNDPLINDSLKIEDGTEVQISK